MRKNELITIDYYEGKHSGRHAFTNHLKELGYTNLSEDQIQKAFDRFKKVAGTSLLFD